MAASHNRPWYEADLGGLVLQGASIFILDGKLHISNGSGGYAPPNWLRTNQFSIAEAIGKQLSLPMYRYLDYSVGNYIDGVAPGICLQFEEVAICHPA